MIIEQTGIRPRERIQRRTPRTYLVEVLQNRIEILKNELKALKTLAKELKYKVSVLQKQLTLCKRSLTQSKSHTKALETQIAQMNLLYNGIINKLQKGIEILKYGLTQTKNGKKVKPEALKTAVETLKLQIYIYKEAVREATVVVPAIMGKLENAKADLNLAKEQNRSLLRNLAIVGGGFCLATLLHKYIQAKK